MNNELRIKVKKFFVLLPSFIILLSLFINPVMAAESTNSAQPSSIQVKLDALKKEIASKAASLKNNVNKKIQNKAYLGIISENNTSSIKILAKKGEKQVNINEYTVYQDTAKSAKKTLTIKDILKDDTVVVLGDVDDKGLMMAKKIIRLPKKDNTELKFLWGQIQSVNNGVIKILDKDNQTVNIVTTDDTLFKLGTEESSIMDAKIKKFLAAQIIGKSGAETAKFVYFIPSVGFIKPEKKIASPSATPKAASPSATSKKK